MRRFFSWVCAISLLVLPCRGGEKPRVALTFDDGPSGRFTRRLLEGLEARDVRATFFLCGYRLRDYPKEAAAIAQAGHELGIHGFSHDPMDRMTPEQLRQEIRDTARLLPAPAVFLRPPGGKANDRVLSAARAEGLPVLLWSCDPKDWAISDRDTVVRRVLGEVKDGDVILLHDMTDSSVDAALAIADALKKRGYQLVTVSELAAARGITPVPGTVYTGFPP